MPIYKSFDAAAEAVQNMLSANATALPAAEAEDSEGEESEASMHRDLQSSSVSSEEESAEASDASQEGMDSASEDEDDSGLLAKSQKSGLTAEEEAEFARDLAKMMSDTGTSKSLNARANLDVGLPLLRRDASGPISQDHMTFNLLTKKGAKPQVSTNGGHLYQYADFDAPGQELRNPN